MSLWLQFRWTCSLLHFLFRAGCHVKGSVLYATNKMSSNVLSTSVVSLSECAPQSQWKNYLWNLSYYFVIWTDTFTHTKTRKHALKPDLHLSLCPCSELQPEPWGVPRLPEWEGVRRGGVSPGVSAGGGGDRYRSGPLPLMHHHHRRQPAQRQSPPKPAPPS